MYEISTIENKDYVLLVLPSGMTQLVEDTQGSTSWAAYQEWLSEGNVPGIWLPEDNKIE
jgi:hypothetical protein